MDFRKATFIKRSIGQQEVFYSMDERPLVIGCSLAENGGQFPDRLRLLDASTQHLFPLQHRARNEFTGLRNSSQERDSTCRGTPKLAPRKFRHGHCFPEIWADVRLDRGT